MTLDEKIVLVQTRFGMPLRGRPEPAGALHSAGFNPGIPRLGVSPLQETDAGLGIANPTNAAFDATAMPSGLALGATFDSALAGRAGRAIGAEARAKGFSVLLGGGADLVRDPRGGRNFEYVGEDPLLTATIAGAEITGIRSQGLVATLKHFVLNAQENGRVALSANLEEGAARESDLLAFELALERGRPGAVMAGYNRIDGIYASENAHMISNVLKGDWGFAGWVMSDWGGTHSTVHAALAGLDQESGADLDPTVFFGVPLETAVADGRVPIARLDDMVVRMLRSRIAAGLFDRPPRAGRVGDLAAHARVARDVAARGIVLLKNSGDVLPLSTIRGRILVVGAHADLGVLSGGGSSQVVPQGSVRFEGDPPGAFYGKPKLYDPSSPLEALKRAAPRATVSFVDGSDVAAAVRAAHAADTVVVFAEQWMNESRDAPNLSLPHGQDALIAAVAAANARTVVVLETGGPITMPWLDAVPAVVEAWYSGERGGDAVADVLVGKVDPSGRLPVSFPVDEDQLPRPREIDPASTTSNPGERIKGALFPVDYNIEGADVGYKWFLRKERRPLFPFGFGLSYTGFAITHVAARSRAGTLAVGFDVRNEGNREGIDTAQIYLDGPDFTRRLVSFTPVPLRAGQTRHVDLRIDARLIARYDVAAHGWRIAPGRYTISVRPNAMDAGPEMAIDLAGRHWPARHQRRGT